MREQLQKPKLVLLLEMKWRVLMSESSATAAEKARKAHSRVLRAMETPGKGGALAVALGTSDTTISNHKKEHLERSIEVLYALGFKVVSADAKTIDHETYAFLTRKHEHVLRVAPSLIWESEE